MRKNIFITAFAQLSDWIFFLILVFYQLIFIFQGIDFADEGYYATFYQQIFSDPHSVVMNFMYWFSGILGGAFFYLFPKLGLIGIRILGVIVVTSTLISVYYLLRRHIKLLHLRIGILLLVLFISNDPKEMYYNNLSALLFILSASFLFRGLMENRLTYIFVSGVFISINMFTRTPSVIGLVFSAAIIYNGFINKEYLKYQLKQLAFFFAGFVLMTVSVLLIMKLLNHLSIYIESLKIVFGWGNSNDDTHNLGRLIKQFIKDYSKSLVYGFLLLTFIIILNAIGNALTHLSKINSKILLKLGRSILIVVFLYLTITQSISWIIVLWVFTGLSLISAILILIMSSDKAVKLLVLLGCLILLFAPFGSAGGLSTMGRYSLWLILPIAIDFMLSIRSINSKSFVLMNSQDYLLNISISESQLNRIKVNFVVLSAIICLYHTYYYPYFDMSDRSRMYYSVDNKFAKGVFTTKERTTSINELLKESGKYIKKNDYVLAYDCIPMVHFLTETRPFMHNSWPWLYIPDAFLAELQIAVKNSNQFPVVILQKMSTLNSDWPQNQYNGFPKSEPDFARDSIINSFINENEYTKVWENNAFEILITDKHFLCKE